MARITHPNPPSEGTFTDRVGEVVFHDGFAEVDLTDAPILTEYYVKYGYDIDYGPELEALTVPDLTEILKDYGYDVKASWRKAELIERIEQHRELNTEKVMPPTGPEGFAIVELADGTVVGDGSSIVTLHADGTATSDSSD